MFTDYIKPEFTYQSSGTTIDYDRKLVKIGFAITDKYFESLTMTLDEIAKNIGIEIDWSEMPEGAVLTKQLTKQTFDADIKDGDITYKIEFSGLEVISKILASDSK